MPLTVDYVTNLFENLSNGKREVFIDNVIEHIPWTMRVHICLPMCIIKKMTYCNVHLNAMTGF